MGDAHDVSADRLLVGPHHGPAVNGRDDLVGDDDGDAKLVGEAHQRPEELCQVHLALVGRSAAGRKESV